MEIQTRHNAESISMSLMRQQAQQAEDVIEEMAKNFWPMIGTANQCAYNAIDEAIDAMKECGLWRQQAKVKAMKAVAEYERYDSAVHRHFDACDNDRYWLWADLVSRAAEKLEPDVQKLYFAVKNVIDSHKCPNSVALAKIQTALALVTLSTLMFDTMAAQFQRRTMVPIADTFRGGRLTAVESLWKAVGDITGRQVMQGVDLKDNEACRLGVEVILTRYQSAEFLNVAAGEALRLNPECEKYIKDKNESES